MKTLFAVALAFFSTVSLAETLSIKGAQLGMSKAEVATALGLESCLEYLSGGCMPQICYPLKTLTSCTVSKQTFASIPVYISFAFSADDKLCLTQLTIPATQYLIIKQALIAKYGAPLNVESKNVSNAMGATFDNEIVSWGKDDAIFKLEQRAVTMDKGLVSLTSKQCTQKILNADAAKAQDDL